MNPWNKDKDGRPKTGQEIWEELDKSAAEKVAAIEREGIICKPCSEARDQAPTNPEDDGA